MSVFERHMPSIPITPRVVYPGINFDAYTAPDASKSDPDIAQISSYVSFTIFLSPLSVNVSLAVTGQRCYRSTASSRRRTECSRSSRLPCFERMILSLRRAASALPSPVGPVAFRLRVRATDHSPGGYDPRLQDNIKTLETMLESAKTHSLSYIILTPSTSTVPLPSYPSTAASAQAADVVFLLNFSGPQRSALLNAPSTQVLLYTPANEHFGIGPVEGMICGLPVLAADSGGPTESVVDAPPSEKTGWLRNPQPEVWAEALREIVGLTGEEREALSERARKRAREKFGMDAMARDMEVALKETVAMGPVPTPVAFWAVVALFFGLLAYVVQLAFL